jgi:hypothetical protein
MASSLVTACTGNPSASAIDVNALTSSQNAVELCNKLVEDAAVLFKEEPSAFAGKGWTLRLFAPHHGTDWQLGSCELR